MADDLLKALPVRRGHFLLESGYHTDLWFTLDALFVDPEHLKPEVTALANMLRPYSITAVCGPLLGGAFLAQAIAAEMRIRFYYSEPAPLKQGGGLFTADYRLPRELQRRAGKERLAIVDDMISAGSSVRATATALTDTGATVAVIATIALLGNLANDYFSAAGIPLIALAQEKFNLWAPAECSLCMDGIQLEDPHSAV